MTAAVYSHCLYIWGWGCHSSFVASGKVSSIIGLRRASGFNFCVNTFSHLSFDPCSDDRSLWSWRDLSIESSFPQQASISHHDALPTSCTCGSFVASGPVTSSLQCRGWPDTDMEIFLRDVQISHSKGLGVFCTDLWQRVLRSHSALCIKFAFHSCQPANSAMPLELESFKC